MAQSTKGAGTLRRAVRSQQKVQARFAVPFAVKRMPEF